MYPYITSYSILHRASVLPFKRKIERNQIQCYLQLSISHMIYERNRPTIGEINIVKPSSIDQTCQLYWIHQYLSSAITHFYFEWKKLNPILGHSDGNDIFTDS